MLSRQVKIITALAVLLGFMAPQNYVSAKPKADLVPDSVRASIGYNLNGGVKFSDGDGVNFSRDSNPVGDVTPDQPLSGNGKGYASLDADLLWDLNKSGLSGVVGLGYFTGSGSYDDTSVGSQTFTGGYIPGSTSSEVDFNGYKVSLGLEQRFPLNKKVDATLAGRLGGAFVNGSLNATSHVEADDSGYHLESDATGNADFSAVVPFAEVNVGVQWTPDKKRHWTLGANVGYGVGSSALEWDGKMRTTANQSVTGNGVNVSSTGQSGDGEAVGGEFDTGGVRVGIFAKYNF